MDCPYCEYSWQSRVSQPKACPRCKNRLDFSRQSTKSVDVRKMLEEA